MLCTTFRGFTTSSVGVFNSCDITTGDRVRSRTSWRGLSSLSEMAIHTSGSHLSVFSHGREGRDSLCSLAQAEDHNLPTSLTTYPPLVMFQLFCYVQGIFLGETLTLVPRTITSHHVSWHAQVHVCTTRVDAVNHVHSQISAP